MNTDALHASSSVTVLIVDDMPENLRILANIVKKEGSNIRLLREGIMVFPSVVND